MKRIKSRSLVRFLIFLAGFSSWSVAFAANDVYSPAGCSLSVKFPVPYSLQQKKVDDKVLEAAITPETVAGQAYDGPAIRAECLSLANPNIKHRVRKDGLNFVEAYANASGLANAKVLSDVLPNGLQVVTAEGSKTIIGIPMKMLIKVISNGSSAMILVFSTDNLNYQRTPHHNIIAGVLSSIRQK